MYIHKCGWHTFCFGALSPHTVIRWHRWRSGPRWGQSWWRCTRAIMPPATLWSLCCAILARKTPVRLIFPNHGRVFCYRSLHLVMPRKHNTPHRLLSNFSEWSLHLLLRFHNGSAQKPGCSHFGHIQGKKHVGLFQLYPTSLSCHSS